jgi:hypothetical protein
MDNRMGMGARNANSSGELNPPNLALAILVSSLVVVGCSPAQGPADQRDTKGQQFTNAVEVNAALGSITRIRYPSVTMQTASYRIFFDCMLEQGFDVPEAVRPTPTESRPAAEQLGTTTLELAESADVASRGYLAALPEPGPVGLSPSDDPLSQWIAALPASRQEDYQRADLGTDAARVTLPSADGTVQTVPGDGCTSRSLDELWRPALKYYTLISATNQLMSDLVSDIGSNDAVVAAKAAWRSCLKAAGYDRDDPELMPSTPGDRDDVTLAVADRNCRLQSELTPTLSAALVASANTRAQQFQALSTDVNDAMAGAEQRALEIIDG